MAKTWRADGTIKSNDRALNCTLEQVEVEDIHGLSALLTDLAKRPGACIIRGTPRGDAVALSEAQLDKHWRPGHVLRRKEVFGDQALHYLMIDVDKFETAEADPLDAIRAFITTRLPEPFWCASFHWQLSGSAGHPSKAGTLNAHLWFWLETPYTSAQLEAWAKPLVGVDRAVFRVVQPNYTADPVFEPGVADPLPVRSGFEDGVLGDEVPLVLEEHALAAREDTDEVTRPRNADDALPDPVADYLWEHNLVRGIGKGGALKVYCPYESLHSSESGDDEAEWFVEGTKGKRGGFYCLHGSHSGMGNVTTTQFLKAIGYTQQEVTESFPVVAGSPVPQAGEDDDLDLPEGSEQYLADVFAGTNAGKYRWTPGLDWMVNKGSHWERDDLLTRYSAAKAICSRAAKPMKPGQAAKACAASTSNALLNLARSAGGVATAVSEWDRHTMLLNTPDGVIDLETGQEVARDGMLFTQVTGVAPRAMPTPVWDKFVSDIFDGDLEMVEFIQRMIGYSLTGSVREQKLFFMHGSGSNGKNVLVDVLMKIGGRYSHNLPAEALMSSKHQMHATVFAALHGKRLAISSEIEESAHWAEAKIKSLTGDATLTARYMRQDDFTFDVTHKHLIAGNFKPRLRGDDTAIARRMVLIPFTQVFTGARVDTRLPEKLQAEYPGILAWAIEGARKWAASGLAIPLSVVESSREYMEENNDITLWINEECEVDPAASTSIKVLYTSFSRWKMGSGEHPQSIKLFSQRLERFYKKHKTGSGMVFQGVKVCEFADFDESNDSQKAATPEK